MIIKHGRHIFGEIHEVRKGLWASISCTMYQHKVDTFYVLSPRRRRPKLVFHCVFYFLVVLDADWLGGQTPHHKSLPNPMESKLQLTSRALADVTSVSPSLDEDALVP